jgi:sulfur-oxidizing protein SoxY
LLLSLACCPALRRRRPAGFTAPPFDAKSLADVLKTLGASAPAESKVVSLQAPDIAENGAVVPLGASTTLPGVKRILLLVEKNPNALAAVFDLGDGIDATVATRVKMGQTSNVYAVAITADNKVLSRRRKSRSRSVAAAAEATRKRLEHGRPTRCASARRFKAATPSCAC